MLAQNFKTAKELGLTKKGLEAYIKTLRMLESGELVYTPQGHFVPNGFNMATVWVEEASCGSIGCIIGWAQHLAGPNQMYLRRETDSKSAMDHLAMPPNWGSGQYTVDQAAKALRSFLVTGEADWS